MDQKNKDELYNERIRRQCRERLKNRKPAANKGRIAYEWGWEYYSQFDTGMGTRKEWG